MSWTVEQGDCVERMRELEEASIDAIVCDPPYGLEFMGKDWDRLWNEGGDDFSDDKKWGKRPAGYRAPYKPNRKCRTCGLWNRDKNPCRCDSPDWEAPKELRVNQEPMRRMQEWHTRWAVEAWRVLKPGGHLLAFGGTRTYHRLACAIEDAGFEIRDSLIWLYGSGFPKSLDVSKAIDRRREDNSDWKRLGGWLRKQRGSMSAKQLCGEIGAHGAVNHGGAVSNWENGFSCPTLADWVALKQALGFGDDMDAEVWRLNGRKGQPGENWEKREKVGEKALTKMNPYAFEDGHAGKVDITAPATPEAQKWNGWGTALKPGHEPIVVARKPLSGTVAQNVTEHGTGALNIDGCRIEGEPPSVPQPAGRVYQAVTGRNGEMSEASGRWAANVLLSHLPECEQVGVRKVKVVGATAHQKHHGKGQMLNPGEGKAEHPGYRDPDGTETIPAYNCAPGCPIAELDEQSGEGSSTNGGSFQREMTSRGYEGGGLGQRRAEDHGPTDLEKPGYGDRGGASRFFYTAKASRGERNAGLADGERSTHPTVKPIDLMRWLVRLVTPPGGTVLDPFAGSGTTGVAAVLEGFDFLGIEREAEYAEIARARIEWWSQFPGEDTDEVLIRAGFSERLEREHREAGQMGLL